MAKDNQIKNAINQAVSSDAKVSGKKPQGKLSLFGTQDEQTSLEKDIQEAARKTVEEEKREPRMTPVGVRGGKLDVGEIDVEEEPKEQPKEETPSLSVLGDATRQALRDTGETRESVIRAPEPPEGPISRGVYEAKQFAEDVAPEPLRTLSEVIKEGLVGKSRDVPAEDLPIGERGALGFFYPSVVDTEQTRFFRRTRELEKQGVEPERAAEVAAQFRQPGGTFETESLEGLSPEERKGIEEARSQERLESAFALLDAPTGGTFGAGSKVVRGLSKADEATQAKKFLKEAGIVDDLADQRAARFVDETDETRIADELENIQLEQNTQIARSIADDIAQTDEAGQITARLRSVGVDTQNARQKAKQLAEETDPDKIARQLAPEDFKRADQKGVDLTPTRQADEARQAEVTGRQADEVAQADIPEDVVQEARKYDSEVVNKARQADNVDDFTGRLTTDEVQNLEQAGFTPQGVFESVRGEEILEELQPLAEEARKYDSAEEFRSAFFNKEREIFDNQTLKNQLSDQIGVRRAENLVSGKVVKTKDGTKLKTVDDFIEYGNKNRSKLNDPEAFDEFVIQYRKFKNQREIDGYITDIGGNKESLEQFFNRVKGGARTTEADQIRQLDETTSNKLESARTNADKGNLDNAQQQLDEIMDSDISIEQKTAIASDLQRRAARQGEEFSISDEAVEKAAKKSVRSDMSPEAVRGQRKATTEKNRGFIETVRNSEETNPAVRENLTGRTYEPMSNQEAASRAERRIRDEGVDSAENFVVSSTKPGAEETATAIQLVKRFQDEGNYQRAARVADSVAEQLTRSGQHIQASKLYSNLSKEGLIIRAQKILRNENIKKFKWESENTTLDEDFQKRIEDLADARDNATDPEMREELEAEIGTLMESLKRVSFGDKISMAQTEMLLLNPKTWVRNIVGNELFYRVERLNKYPATLIDWTRSGITGGERQITLAKPKQGEYWKNFMRGAKMGWKGTVPPGTPTQFDLPTAPTFKSPKNPFYWGEKMLGAGLRGFDFAGYKRAQQETLGELGWLRAKNEGFKGKQLKQKAVEYAENADDNLLQTAHEYGKYVTFQDDNVMSEGFQSVKRTLNKILGTGDFGAGDVVLKFPKTPANLLMRGIEYSPAGFIRSAYLIGKPILKGGADVREITQSVSRATTGSAGLMGLGYFLADKGIITGKGEDDRDLSGLQRIHGTGAYRLNVDALKRWVLSGFDENATERQDGDLMVSYDWAQPAALGVSAGANINEQQESGDVDSFGAATKFVESLEAGVNTLAEQPLVSGISRMFGYGDPVAGVSRTLLSAPSSFTPTLARQLNSWYDNTRRMAYNPDVIAQNLNYAKRSVPGLAQQLPVKVNQWGENAEKYKNKSNNLFNVFFNPAFANEFDKNPEGALVFDLVERAGETKQVPRIAPDRVTVNGEEKQLTPEQKQQFQRIMGEETKRAFNEYAESQVFMDLPDAEKAEIMSETMSNIKQQTEDKIFGTNEASGRTYKDRLNFLKVERMMQQGREEEAKDYVQNMSDEEWQKYKSLRSSWRASNTRKANRLLEQDPVRAVTFVQTLPRPEAQRIVDNMSEEEWQKYKENKDDANANIDDIKADNRKLRQKMSELYSIQEKEGTVAPDTIIGKVVEFSKTMAMDPVDTFKFMFTGEELRRMENGSVIFEDMPEEKRSQIDYRERGGEVGDNLELDHKIPQQLGGSNDRDNLELIPRQEHRRYTAVGNYLGLLFRQGVIGEGDAQDIMLQYRSGEINEQDVLNKTEKAFQEVKD